MRAHLSVVLPVVLILSFIVTAALLPVAARGIAAQQNISEDEQSEPSKAASAADLRLAARGLESLPLYFIPNQGQTDERVSFYVLGSNQAVYFTPQGVTFAIAAPPEPVEQALAADAFRAIHEEPKTGQVRQHWVVKLDFVGANPEVQPVGELPTQTIVSYFKGAPDQWRSGLPTYARLRYPNLWPGIDLVYTGHVDELKYEFVVQPGADPGLIQLTYRGASDVQLLEDGQLEISTPLGAFHDAAPVAYQVRNNQRLPVEMAFALETSKRTGEQAGYRYGFELGEYNPTLPLILDPALLVYAGFIGGEYNDQGNAIALDGADNVYLTGETHSTTFPTEVGPDLDPNGHWDAFVAKLNAAGTTLLYAGFIGGDLSEFSNSIAVDADGYAYITGYTFSDENSFPVLGGPDLTINGDYYDAFVAKVNPGGTELVYAGYIGGTQMDSGESIAVDQEGAAYISGYTASDDGSFPVAVGPDLTSNNIPGYSLRDAFVTKVNSAGTGLVYSGYIGGSYDDVAFDIAVDGQGNAYITGATTSDESDFPVTVGPDLTYNGYEPDYYQDGFVAKVNPSGSGLVYAGYIGGLARDSGNAIAVDGAGNAYVTGWTEGFPAIAGPDLSYNYQGDAFVLKLEPSGAALVFSGFIGGEAADAGTDLALGADGVIYVTGSTRSDEATFPVLDGPDDTHNGGVDAFITAIKPPEGSVWQVYSGFIGGSGDDYSNGIAVDPSGNAYIIGYTTSTEDSFPVKGGPDPTHNGITDVFVVKVGAWHLGEIDLSVSRVEVIQGITMSDSYSVYIANKPAMLRAFVNLQGVASVNGVHARLTRYVGGAAQDSIEIGPVTVFADSEEGDLLHTLNFDLPSHWLLPGTGYSLQLDPEQALPETIESNNRYPASGSKSFNFVNAPVLEVVIVPVTYARPGEPVTNPKLDDLSYLTWMPEQVYPVAQINYTVRSTPHTFSGDLMTYEGWYQLLNDITTIHAQEDPQQDKIYYGLVDAYTAEIGFFLGIAWRNSPSTPMQKTGVGVAGLSPYEVSSTFTHEVAHIFGLSHVESCGIIFPPFEENYPYEEASIGHWGLNHVTGELFDPQIARDYMSYCNNVWTSDYTYYRLYQSFRWVEGWNIEYTNRVFLPAFYKGGSVTRAALYSSNQSFSLSGFVAADGSLHVEPLFIAPRPPDRPGSTGEYAVVLLDASGRVLLAQPLALTQIAVEYSDSGEMIAGFNVALPYVEGVAGIQVLKEGLPVFERRAASSAPLLGSLGRAESTDGESQFSWVSRETGSNLSYRVLYSPDGGASWQVLAANTTRPELDVSESLLQGAAQPQLWVQVSDGVRIGGQVYKLAIP